MNKINKNISSNQKTSNTRVLVGISGGVDSSVCAVLLIKQGYEVEGVFAKVWQPEFVECTWRDEMKDAMRVCAKLNIPFHFLDLEKEYETHVAQYMINEYKSGRTPNPDVMCNTYIKFGFMYDYARSKGFEYIATGHYAQIEDMQLVRGLDTNKDQSYFLWNVKKDVLKHAFFPVGSLKKSEVRSIAKKNNLFTSEKKDSQGLCFIGPVDMKSFLKNLIETKKGSVLNTNNEIIGEHEGAQLYTVGERHGFTIYPECKATDESVQYVIDKDIKHNTITIGTSMYEIKHLTLSNLNWFINPESIIDSTIEVQFRYRQEPSHAQIIFKNNEYILILENKKQFVAEGQSAVLYDGIKCLGGGIIQTIKRTAF